MLIIIGRTGDFRFSPAQALLNRLFIFTAAAAQASFKLLHIGRQHKDRGRTRIELFDIPGPFHFDHQNHRLLGLHAAFHFGTQGSVVVITIAGIFYNAAGVQRLFELFLGQEVVTHAIHFPFTHGTGCGRNGLFDLLVVRQQPGHHGILARTRRPGNNKQVFFTFHI